MAERRINSGYAVLLAQLLEEKEEQLLAGYASDWADYRERKGYIEAVRRCIDICEEYYAKMTGGHVRDDQNIGR